MTRFTFVTYGLLTSLLATPPTADTAGSVQLGGSSIAPPALATPDGPAPLLSGSAVAPPDLTGYADMMALQGTIVPPSVIGQGNLVALIGEGEGVPLSFEGRPPPLPVITPSAPPQPTAPPDPILPSDALFDHDSAVLKPSAMVILRDVAEVFSRRADLHAEIHAHTSSVGQASYNLQLSTDRMAAVKAALIRFGVPASRLTTFAHGETQLLNLGQTKADHAANRRVEVHFY